MVAAVRAGRWLRVGRRAQCVVVVVSMMAGGLAAARQAQAQAAERSFDIPAQPLATALTTFGQQSGLQVSAPAELLQGRTSTAVTGNLTPAQAVSRLLIGTGLTFRISGTTVTLEPAPPPSDSAVQLGPVRVEGAGDVLRAYAVDDPGRTEGSPSYAARSTNTSFKLPLTLQETPQTVVVVPQAAIRDFNLTNVKEILEFTPGVTVQPERSQSYYYYESRGHGMQVQYDGAASPNGFGGRGASTTPDSALIDRVEVLQGAAGLMVGSGAPGGVVNLIRKMPTSTPQVDVDLIGDSWGGWRGVADVSGPIGRSGLGGRLVSVFEQQDSYVDYVSGMHALFYGVVDRKIGDDTTVAAGLTFDQTFDYAPGAHYGVPTAVDGTPYDIPRSRNLGATWGRQDDSGRNVFVRAQRNLGTTWKTQTLVSYESFKTYALESANGRPRIDADWVQIIALGAQIESWYSRNRSIDANAHGDVRLFGRDHQLMFGLNGSWRDNGSDYGAGSSQPLAIIDPYTWDAAAAPGPYSQPLEEWGGWTGENRNYGVYGGGRFEVLEGLHVLAGGRTSWYRQSWDGATANNEDAAWTPYGALTWNVVEPLTAYVSYTNIFQPHEVWVRDRTGKTLAPVTGANTETGLKLSLLGGDLVAQAAFFRLNQTNLAVPDFEGELAGVCGGEFLDACAQATGNVPGRGADVSIAGTILPGFQVLGGYAYSRKDDGWSPRRHSWNFAASYAAPTDRWQIGGTLRHQSGFEYSEGFYFAEDLIYTVKQKPFTVFAFNGRYNLTERLSASIEIENLFDKTYLAQQDWPVNGSVWGNPRRASVTLRTRF